MAKWSISPDKYVKTQKFNLKNIRRNLAFLLYNSIVKLTPVDTGRARGNWLITTGRPSSKTIDIKGHEIQHRNLNNVPLPEGDKSIFISNNLPYINKLEYGGYPETVEKGTWVKGKGGAKGYYEKRSAGGYSKRTPNGMVGLTLIKAKQFILQAIGGVK